MPTGSGLRATSFHSFLFIISALPPCNSSVLALVVERTPWIDLAARSDSKRFH